MIMLRSRLQGGVRIAAIAVLALAAPLAFSADGVTVNSACAASLGNGSCCPKNAICGLNGQNYPGFHFVAGSCDDEIEAQ